MINFESTKIRRIKFPEHNQMSLLDCLNAWVEKVNHGGLYEVSDQFYLFTCTVKLIVRSVQNYNLTVICVPVKI